jgi:signal transduction histidine kinase
LAGGITIKPQPCDMRVLVERVIHEHQAAAPGRVLAVDFRGNCAGQWDSERVAQVASNLIGNALKHGDERSGVQVNVDGSSPVCVGLSVSNRGTIPAELVGHLFDPFRGGQRAPGRSAGLGLGLYIVYQIVKAHSGTVDVETGRDDRTTFRVVLPRVSE